MAVKGWREHSAAGATGGREREGGRDGDDGGFAAVEVEVAWDSNQHRAGRAPVSSPGKPVKTATCCVTCSRSACPRLNEYIREARERKRERVYTACICTLAHPPHLLPLSAPFLRVRPSVTPRVPRFHIIYIRRWLNEIGTPRKS